MSEKGPKRSWYRRGPVLVASGAGLLLYSCFAAGPLSEIGLSLDSPAWAAAPPTPSGIRVVGFGHIDVEGGTIPLSPAIAGQVENIPVTEGEHVAAGTPLVQLSEAQARAQQREAEAAVEQATVKLRQSNRVKDLYSIKLQLQDQAIRVAQNKLDAGLREYKQLKELVGNDVVPNDRLLSAHDLVENLRSALEAEQLKRQELELERPLESVELAQAAVRLAEAKLAQANEFLSRHTLRAPTAGTVLRVQLSPGQMTAPGLGLQAIWFAPDKPRIVRCEIDQAFADRVQPGMRAEIDDDRLNGQRWTGYVERCGDWIAQRRSLLDEPFQKNDVRTLETIITLDPGQPELRIGQRMRVTLTDGFSDARSATAQR